MASNTEQLIFEILAKDAQASAAFDRFRNKVNQTSKSVGDNSKALDDNAKALDKNKQSNVSAMGALIGVGTAFLPIAAGVTAVGLGVSAFAATAVPSVKKVSAALTDKNGLADSWVTLDNRQKNAALSVQALGKDYSDLARTMEPEVFQVFNQGLTIANGLLKPTGQLAHTSGQGISDFLATFSQDSGLSHFITYLSTIARPAIGLVGSDVTHVAHAVFSLLESFSGAGMLELRALTGVFTGLDDSISFLSQHAPGLTSAALGIGGIALALSKMGLLSGALKITGISSIAGQMTGFADATKGATLAEKGMLATTTALDAINPWAWVALGVAAVGGLVFWLSKSKTAADNSVSSLEAANKAVGFNTSGYLAAAAAIKKTSDQQGQATIQLRNARSGMVNGTASINALTGATDTYTSAQKALIAGAKQQDSFLEVLQAKYHITREQAQQLASSSGVLVDKNGKLVLSFGASVSKAEAFANANRNAQLPVNQLTKDLEDFSNKTLTATQRQTALTNALKLFFDPATKADQDIITLKNDQAAMATALGTSAGKTGLLTQAQRDARGAFDTYIGDVATAASDAFTATNKQSDYNRIIRNALPGLYAAAKGNAVLRGEVDKLKATLAGLGPESVQLSVGATGTWTVTQFQAPGGGKHAVNSASGRLVTGGVPGRDSVLVNAMPGEVIVPTSMVNAGAVDHLRGSIPGFADGGVVGGFKGSVPGMGPWLRTMDNQTLIALENAVAAATFAGIRHAQATSIGGLTSGNAIVDFASQFVGKLPYVWGGTSLVTGADCAGFTEAVYGHFGISIPRTSEEQFAFMARSGDRPGALVFFVSPAGGPPPGHVGISDGHGMMVNAAGTQFGTIVSSSGGNMGFGIPPNPATGNRGSGPGLPPKITNGAMSFDRGGYLEPGLTLAYNGTGRPEPVGGGNVTININVSVPPTVNPREVGRQIGEMILAHTRTGGHLYPQGVTPR